MVKKLLIFLGPIPALAHRLDEEVTDWTRSESENNETKLGSNDDHLIMIDMCLNK